MKIGNTLYFDHQATTPVDARVLAAMEPHLAESFGNPHSTDHSLGWQAARAVEDAAARVAWLIGADADEVVFTSGATESNNLALLGLGRRAAGDGRRRILVSAIEHKCVLAASRALHEQCGYRVETLPVERDGRLALSTLEGVLDDDVLLVSVMAVNNEIGTIQDIAGISALLKDRDILFHCDAAQGPCALDLRAIAARVDYLSLSAHKMYGPKGIGALFVRRELQDRIEPLVYGGGQQNNLRPGTVPTPLCVGMGAAADLLSGTQAGEERTVRSGTSSGQRQRPLHGLFGSRRSRRAAAETGGLDGVGVYVRDSRTLARPACRGAFRGRCGCLDSVQLGPVHDGCGRG